MKTNIDIFERLKKKKTVIEKRKSACPVFFQLCFDEGGAYITVIDQKGKEIDVNYESYTAGTREVLKSIENIKDKNNFCIDWQTPNNNIYLAHHEYLLWQLQHCDNFVDIKFNPIGFSEGSGKIIACIEEKNQACLVEVLNSKIVLSHHGNRFEKFSFLNEDHLLANGSIYQIQPLGENFKELALFETVLFPINLEKYLCLLYSYFENIQVNYKDYKEVPGEPKQTKPTLIFEKVDADNLLYLRLAVSLPGFEQEFFENYDVAKVVLLNDLEKKIIISDLVMEEIFTGFSEIEKLLKRYKNSNNSYFVEDNLFIIEESLAREFIYKELPYLLTRFTVLGAEKLKSYRVKTVTPNLKLSLSHAIDFLEGDVNLDIEGEIIPLFEALNQYKKNSYIALNDGTCAIINKSYIDKLHRIFKKQKEKVRISFFDLPLVEELIDEKIAGESFKHSREIFLGFNKLKGSKVEFPKLNGELRDYQKQGYKWLRYLNKHCLGGCLADDMGLGKTVQAISMLADIYPEEKKASLILMPKTLLFN